MNHFRIIFHLSLDCRKMDQLTKRICAIHIGHRPDDIYEEEQDEEERVEDKRQWDKQIPVQIRFLR